MGKLLLVFLIFLSTACLSQNEKWYPVHLRIGGNIINTVDNYFYRPLNFLVQIPYLLKESTYDGSDRVTDMLFLTVEPNFSVVRIRKDSVSSKSEFFELGVLLGLKQVHRLNRFTVFSEPFLGVIMISYADEKQTGGFNFNLGYELGLSYRFKGVEVSYGARFRHVSNAGLQLPNAGIDNILMYLGVTKSIF